MTKQFNDQNFKDEVIETSKTKPVLVDFFAEWCGPCKMQGPIIDEISEELKEEASIGKLNTELAGNTAREYGVMSIPTLILFKDGEAKETLVGLQSKDALKNVISNYL